MNIELVLNQHLVPQVGLWTKKKQSCVISKTAVRKRDETVNWVKPGRALNLEEPHTTLQALHWMAIGYNAEHLSVYCMCSSETQDLEILRKPKHACKHCLYMHLKNQIYGRLSAVTRFLKCYVKDKPGFCNRGRYLQKPDIPSKKKQTHTHTHTKYIRKQHNVSLYSYNKSIGNPYWCKLVSTEKKSLVNKQLAFFSVCAPQKLEFLICTKIGTFRFHRRSPSFHLSNSLQTVMCPSHQC